MGDNEIQQIKNVIIFDGINQYDNEQIYSNIILKRLVNNAVVFGGLVTLISRINEENGILYIETDKNYSYHKSYLKNVSIELLDSWNKRRP